MRRREEKQENPFSSLEEFLGTPSKLGLGLLIVNPVFMEHWD